MCTILVADRCLPDARLVLAANRDELRGRPSAPPGILVATPRVAGGRDLVAGGTWLAVAAGGSVAAVTNRQVEARDPARRSRGELPLLALAAAGAAGDGRGFIEALDPAAYNPCNLLLATAAGILVAHLEGRSPRVVELEPGPHVLTTVDLDAPGDSKVARLRRGLDGAVAAAADAAALQLRLEGLLRDHGPNGAAGRDAACIHGDVYGTVSSASVSVDAWGRTAYRHAPGRPCETAHADFSVLLGGPGTDGAGGP